MLTYSTIHTRDHIVQKKSDNKPCSLEGFSTLEKLYLNANAPNVTRWDKLQWLKIIWEHIHDPMIQKLCDFGLYKHNSQ